MKAFKNTLESMANNPLVELGRLTRDVKPAILAKLEFFNPSGSVKDRMAIYMVEDAERRGLLKPGGTIVESSSGNTGATLAMITAAKGQLKTPTDGINHITESSRAGESQPHGLPEVGVDLSIYASGAYSGASFRVFQEGSQYGITKKWKFFGSSKPRVSCQNRTSLFQKRCCRFDNDIITLKKGGTHEHIDLAPGFDHPCLSFDTGDWSGN